MTTQNSIQDEMKCRLKAGNSCYYLEQKFLFPRFLSKNLKIKIYKTIILTVVLSMVSYIKGGKQAKNI